MTKDTPVNPTPRKRRFRLGTAEEVRQYLAGVVTRLENGELHDSGAKTRAYLGQVLVRIIEGADLEGRVQELEARFGGKEASHARQ